MIGSEFTYQRLSKNLFLNLLKFGCQFSCAQKRLPISKIPCITPCSESSPNSKNYTKFCDFQKIMNILLDAMCYVKNETL